MNTTQATEQFIINLKNSITDTDKKESVQYLAKQIGSAVANKIAASYGLTRMYYQAT